MAEEDVPFIREGTKEHRRLEQKKRNLKTPWHLLLLVLSTSLLSIVLTLAFERTSSPRSSVPNLKVPSLGKILKKFEFQPIYSGRPNATTKTAWSYLIPKGKGFVSIDKLEAASGPLHFLHAQDIENHGQLAVSVFHQLHCLWMLRKGYYDATDGHDHNVEHIHHCFEYIRQSIMCAADTALEPFKDDIHGVDGFGNDHQCRDFEEVFNWAEEMRFGEAEGI